MIDYDSNTVFGALGLQLKQSDYFKLIPSAVLEEPYTLSYISALDQDFNVVWTYNNDPKPQKEGDVVTDKEPAIPLDEEEADYVVQQGIMGLQEKILAA